MPNSRSRIAARIDKRELRLGRLGYRDYTAFLGSVRWEETRAAYWNDPETPKVCAVCGTDEPPLPLHHRTYERVGAERMDDLTPVCLTCHALVHELERRGDLDGLDADLTVLTDPERARLYRRERSQRPVQPTPENLRMQKKLLARITGDEHAVTAARHRRNKLKESAAQRRLKRAQTRLKWLQDHPELVPDPLAN